jgi:NAD(P)-dependent dehydrogenase (short-subunit alcohol dehydrogenase family)
MSDLSDSTTVVVGASRGLGRGIAHAFAEAGAPVVAVARTGPALAELATTSANIRTEVADAADGNVAWNVLDRYEPEVLILVAGANPVMGPLQDQTWETFSVNWHTDVEIAFTSLREALLKTLPPSSRVVVVSSAAAINGSPISAGHGPGRHWPPGNLPLAGRTLRDRTAGTSNPSARWAAQACLGERW